jgi:hypothetical protein
VSFPIWVDLVILVLIIVAVVFWLLVGGRS